MATKIAVYGVLGLTEWEVLIPAGRGRLRIKFEGGSVSGHGIVPATYRTDRKALMRLIEASPQFQSGRIRRIH